MNTMCEKVKKIMVNVIDCCITKEDAMEVLRVKYDWLYPYITEAVWSEHYSLYINSKGLLVEELVKSVTNKISIVKFTPKMDINEPDDEGSTTSEDVDCICLGICAGCDNEIKEDGFCSEGCRYGEIAGF